MQRLAGMNPAFRKFHRTVAPWLMIPLLITALTGMGYRLGKSWFGLDEKLGNIAMDVHSGEWLGRFGSMAYLGLTGLGLLLLIATGATLLLSSRSKMLMRRSHRILALVLMLPLAASAVTGLAYKAGEEFFHIPDEAGEFLMTIHEGAWLGKQIKPFYVLFLGLGLIALLWTGFRMTGLFRRKSPPPAPQTVA